MRMQALRGVGVRGRDRFAFPTYLRSVKSLAARCLLINRILFLELLLLAWCFFFLDYILGIRKYYFISLLLLLLGISVHCPDFMN